MDNNDFDASEFLINLFMKVPVDSYDLTINHFIKLYGKIEDCYISVLGEISHITLSAFISNENNNSNKSKSALDTVEYEIQCFKNEHDVWIFSVEKNDLELLEKNKFTEYYGIYSEFSKLSNDNKIKVKEKALSNNKSRQLFQLATQELKEQFNTHKLNEVSKKELNGIATIKIR